MRMLTMSACRQSDEGNQLTMSRLGQLGKRRLNRAGSVERCLMAAAVLWLSCVQTVTAHLPCARMPPKEQDAATIISAMFRGNDEGLRDIFATAAADSGACFVDVVLPRDAPPAFEVSARSLVDEAAALLVPAAPGVRGIRIAPHSSDHDDVLAGAAMTWGRRGQRCEWQGYHIIMEDGIRYPDDYLEVARGAVDSTGRRAMVGFQGFVWVSEFLKLGVPYLQTTYGLPASGLSGEADSDVWVDVLRLGTTAYHAQLAAHTHTSLTPPKSFDTAAASAAPDTGASATISAQTGWIEPAWFLGSSDSGMQDILLAVQAHYRNVPRLLCSHPADWLTPRPAPVALQQASWWWERNTFPALRPPARSPEPGALEATASEKKAMRLALQFAPWRVLTLDDLPGSFVLRQHTHRLADGSGRATVDFEMLPVDALVFSSVTGLGAEQDRTGADEGADEEFDGAEEDGDGEGTEGTTGGGSEADLQGFTLLVPVYWKTRVRFLQGTLRRLVHMAEVARIIVLWNNPMWPLPPCLLCETEEGLGGGDGVGGDSRSGGEQVSALWEAGGKVVVVLPPCSAESGYASASLNNRFLPYSLIMTEAVLSMDDDFRPTPAQMRELLRTWRAFPHKLVGPMWLVTRSLACRNGEDLGGGAGSWRTDGAVDAPASEVQCSDLVYVTGGWPGYYNVLLTGFAAFHRGWLALYSSDEAGEQGLAAARALVDEQCSCEDILLNFLAASRGAGAPVAVDVGHVNEFDDGGGLSALGSHFAARSRCATSFAAIFRASGAQGLEEGVGRKRNLAFPRADVSGMFRECRWDDLLGRRICTGAFNASRYAVAEAALLDAEGGSAARVRRQMLLMLRDSWDTAALVDGRGCAGVAVGQEEGGGGEALWERTAEDLVTDERPDDVMNVPTLGEKQETMNLGPIVRSQGVVGGAEGETEERVVVVVTVAYNNELMLVKQVETLERFMSDHFHMMVAVDSSTALQRAGMHAHCSRLALECLDTPFSDADDEFEAHDRPSWSHMRALNWLLHTHVFPDFGDEALLLVLDPDVFLLRPFSMRHFACLGGVSCGLAPGGGSRDMMQVQACHLSGIRQDMSQQVFGGESPYLHVAVLMMDLRELPGLRALSLNPWRFDGVHCDSGCGLLDYLYCLGHRDSGPTLLLPAPPPSRLHDSGTQVGGSGPMERESSARQWERFLEARAALLRDGSSKKRVLEYPVDKAHWWSDGVVDAPAEAARGISEDSSAHARAAGPAAAESAAERVPELVVCYLEHGYLGMRGVVNEHGSSGDLPVKAAVGVDGDDVEGSDMSADVGWCVLEGGVCAAGSPGGSEACHQGLPDTLGGGVWMHSRRSSDWDLPRHQVATANAQRPNESEADRWTAWEGLAIRLDSKWRRLQCLIGVINHALDTHPSPHPRPSAAAPDDSWHATAAGADSEPPPSRTLPELMSARNLAFARNGGVVYQAAERSSGLDAWFLPQALCVNDGRLPAHAAGEDQAWTLSHGQAPVVVFRSGLSAEEVGSIELWGSWTACVFRISYMPFPPGRKHAAARAAAGEAAYRVLMPRDAEWLPLCVAVGPGVRGRHGDTCDSGVAVESMERGRVVLWVDAGMGGAKSSSVEARAIRVEAVGVPGVGGLQGRADSAGGQACQVQLHEIAVYAA